MATADELKEVEVTTREPFMTNGKMLPPGKHKVTRAIADDLMRRQHEFDADKQRLLQNNGDNIDALHGGTISG